MSSTKLSYIPALDGLRGISALMIMFFHYFQLHDLLKSAGKVAIMGQTGVDLFFVLSGFLITRILLKMKQQGEEKYFQKFYIRRSLRIFPLYYGFLILTYFLLPLVGYGNNPPLDQQWWYWLYLQNIPSTFHLDSQGPGHFWSLAIEQHFYLLWPLVVYNLDPKKVMSTSLGLAVSSILTRWIFTALGFGTFYFTLCRVDSLALGAILALLELHSNWQYKYNSYFKHFAIAAFLILLITWIPTGGQGLSLIQILKPTIIGLFYFSVIGYFSTQKSEGPLTKLFGGKILTNIGKVSYGMYVFHPLCFKILKNIGFMKGYGLPGFFLSLTTAFLVTYLVAYVSFEAYENLFLKLKSRF